MVDKKFSDFNPKSTLEENDIIPSETLGVSNNRTTYGDLKRQIQEEILSQYGRQSVGRIVYSYCNHVAGIPQGYDDNLIYADGTQHQRNERIEIAKFIDYAKVIPTLKELYQIPESGDYFVVPDLRNKHIVGVGDINPPFSNIVSKTLNPQTVVTTTIAGIGDHSHPINDITGSFNGANVNNTNPNEGFGAFVQEGTTAAKDPFGGNRINARTTFSSHRAGVTATNNAGNHTHTATNTVGYTDPNIFDTVVRVPAMALFTFLDIAINDIYINPVVDISIDEVSGLREELDELDNTKLDNVIFDGFLLDYADDLEQIEAEKLSVNDFTVFQASNNLALSTKVEQSLYDSYVTSNDLAVSNKVENSIYTSYVTSNDLSVASKLPIATFNPTFRSSWNSVRRTGLTVAINNSATVGRNIITDLQNVATTNTGGADFLGNPSLTTGYPTVTNSTAVGNYRLPIITGLTAYRVGITIRVTGTFANTQDQRELFAEIRLANGTTSITTTILRRSIPNTGNPLVGQFEPIRVTSTTDILTTLAGGFQVLLFNNNNPQASTFTMTAIELVFNY